MLYVLSMDKETSSLTRVNVGLVLLGELSTLLINSLKSRKLCLSFINMRWAERGLYQPFHRKRTTVCSSLIWSCIAIFFLQTLNPKITYYLGLVPDRVFHSLWLWQPITYQFLHGSFLHLFFNMFALFIFGRELERAWGGKFFIIYYLTCGISAGLISALVSPHLMIGASGAIYGLLIAFGMLYPNRLLLLYFFIPIKAKYLVILFAIFEFFASLGSPGDHIAHSAHLAGMAVGFIFLKVKQLIETGRVNKMQREFRQRTELEGEVDRILAKLSAFGPESLTERERRLLNEASEFYKNRNNNSFLNF